VRTHFGKGPEAIAKWGKPITDKKETEDWEGASAIHTILEFQDIRIEEREVEEGGDSCGFTFSRKNSGIGGIFCGAAWCDKGYVRSILGAPMEIGKAENSDDQWRYETLSGYSELTLTFSKDGTVSTIRCGIYAD
jgi:hypothetical protein